MDRCTPQGIVSGEQADNEQKLYMYIIQIIPVDLQTIVVSVLVSVLDADTCAHSH